MLENKSVIINCNELTIEQYNEFMQSKLSTHYTVKGRTVEMNDYNNKDIDIDFSGHNHLFDYQKFILEVSLKKRRYAIFADCGLGKTAIFLAWIKQIQKQTKKKILIVSPLSIINQTINEEKKFYNTSTIINLHKKDLNTWIDSDENQIGIINYDKFHSLIDFRNKLGAVVLDESSILKNSDGKTSMTLINSFKGVPFKLCCTATPAPNDREEYATHSTFLEYTRSNKEFLSKYFVNKDNGWVIKGHSLKHFYKELSEWGIYLRDPQKYGFNNNLKGLQKPIIESADIKWTEEQKKLFKNTLFSEHPDDIFTKKHFFLKLSKGFIIRDGKKTIIKNNKVKYIIDTIRNNPNEKIIIWCIYNDEETIIYNELKRLNITAIKISGSTIVEDRITLLDKYKKSKDTNVLITKSKIMGFGINMQECGIHIFSGMNDSYEQFYQAIRRSYRYGATKQLKVLIPVTNAEKTILKNVMSKKETIEEDSFEQEQCFIKNLDSKLKNYFGHEVEKMEIDTKTIVKEYKDNDVTLILGDSIKVMEELKDESIDLSVFSPPFASLFTYSDKIEDMGNSRDSMDEFNLHYEFFLKRLFNITKKGRICCCHLSQLPRFKSLDGYVGNKDFRGNIIKLFEKSGFIFFGEWVIKKNPQMQAIKEKVRSLSFAQLERDRLGSRAGFNDYIFVFKKPGESDVIVNSEDGPTRDEWINWACGTWGDINESNTLNSRGGKGKEDVKHICPLNLEVVRRCVRMYSNKNEVILDPFSGIGTTGVIAKSLNRRYIGIELKQEYFEESIKNIKRYKIMNKEHNLKRLHKIDVESKSLFEDWK